MRVPTIATTIGVLLSLTSVLHSAPQARASTPTCGTLDMPCCSGTDCDPGLICNGATCVGCGGNTEPCCPIDMCDPGFTCASLGESPPSQESGGGAAFSNQCIPCGDSGQPCCDNISCNGGLICQGFAETPPSAGTGSGAITGASLCVPCGDAGEPCCDGDMCNTGAFCESCNGNELAGDGGGATIECPQESQGGGGQIRGPTLCVACGQPGQQCCPVDTCDAGAICHAGLCEQCGEQGEQCCENEMCSFGLACVDAAGEGLGGGAGNNVDPMTCVPCGDLNEPCCAQSTCNDENLLCGGELCEQCGGIGEQCCAAQTCPNSDAVCQEDVCIPSPAVPVMGIAAFFALILTLAGVGLYHLGRSAGLTTRR